MAPTDDAQSPAMLLAFDPLVGNWTGSSTGVFGSAVVEKVGEFLLGGRFFRFRTRSASEREVHEDISMFSFDTGDRRLVLREFYTEGYVITYRQAASSDGTLVFESEHIENPPDPTLRARISMRVEDGHLHETLELSTGGEPLAVCVDLHLDRTEPGRA